ncbi:MAG: Dyp-type peroxidase [Candidatus Acidiferrum sp.]
MSSGERVPPVEPVLELADIQGIAVPGFLKQAQTLLGVRIPEGEEALENFKETLGGVIDGLGTGRAVLDDRRAFRRLKREKNERYPERKDPVVFLAVALSYVGLAKLIPGADEIPSEAFRRGLVQRSPLLGDPTDPGDEGSPAKWMVGAPGGELDALFVLAGDERHDVNEKAERLAELLRRSGVELLYREEGDTLPGDLKGHEHFGFDDGVSQPGIRGRASDAECDFITDRHVAPSEVPATWLYGYPGQDLVWPGEFVIGYPKTSPDPLLAGLADTSFPGWARNGSFLVFRRLRQDVGLFWRTLRDLAKDLSEKPGFSLSDEEVASRLVGRWRSGAPVNRVPAHDDPSLGRDPLANNDFGFDSDTPRLELDPPASQPFPRAKADPVGITCPWAAHIRKVNTRDSSSDVGATDSRYSRRLLRVGIPFGKPLADRYADSSEDPDAKNRGLLFLSIQASIEEQFEFLVARWVNDPARPKMPGGHDLLIGQNTPIPDHTRRATIFGENFAQAELSTIEQWVIPTGGGYFFVPSLSALREVICR